MADDNMPASTRAGLDHERGGFDPDALREKYRRERDRRLREDGEDQYLVVEGKHARYADVDPYAPAPVERASLSDEIDVVVIGGGFSGMLAAARLREAGLNDVRIIESGADFGGTWYWNRYPGAQCDIESYCYLPLLEELGYMPKEKYAFAPEIFEHCQRIGRACDLYPITLFQTRVTALEWDGALKRWRVGTSRGDDIKARFVVSATGSTNRPKLPGIPGIDDFAGHSFHTCRWDYDYTGGDHTGGLTKLADKRIAVIGTGATAIQCVPHLAAHAKALYVFQRTPSSVDFRGNRPTDPVWAGSLGEGWQRERQENFSAVVTGQPFEVDLVHDAWTDIFRNLQTMASFGGKENSLTAEAQDLAEIADFQKMNQVRARVDEVVNDPATAEVLKPWYRQLCKRPTFSDEYLQAFNRPNVTLVDVSGSHGVERITPTGVVGGGVEYEVDCIVFATGFEIGTALRRRMEFDIVGQGGRSLFEAWGEGLRTLHGHSTRGFPNWFFVGVGQNGLSVNMTYMFDEQARHIAYIIQQTRDKGARTVQPTNEAQDAWVAEIRRASTLNEAFLNACTPGYYNGEGKFAQAVGNYAKEFYAPGAGVFNAILAQWRDDGRLEGLEFD
jgi:cyclohexanone monooxygenase